MSDTSATDPAAQGTQGVEKRGDAGAAMSGDAAESGAAAAKPPQRPVSEIRADIEKERAELSASFARLREELDEAADAGQARARESGRRAKRAAPIVVGVLVTAVVARALLRRR